MKKGIITFLFLVVGIINYAQEFNGGIHFDFSAVCESGQTLYYRITDEEAQTVALTHPYEPEPGYQMWPNMYYADYPEPQGEIVLSSFVLYGGVSYRITSIDDHTFSGCSGLCGSFSVPEGVVSIGHYAFGGSLISLHLPASLSIIYGDNGASHSVEVITVDEHNPIYYSENNAIIRREDMALVVGCKTTSIPENIQIIGSYAFYGIETNNTLMLSDNIKVIEDYAFCYSGSSLGTGLLHLPDSLQWIGRFAFDDNNFSGDLVIPNTVTHIGNHAFHYCERLDGNLTLSESLETIEQHAFYRTKFTGTLVVPNSVKHIEHDAFGENKISELILGNSLEGIGTRAFCNCRQLSGSLCIPRSVQSISMQAFCHTAFTEIYSENPVPPEIMYYMFDQNFDSITPVYVPMGSIDAYKNAEGWNLFSNYHELLTSLEGEWYYEILNDDGSITYQYLQCVGDTTLGGEKPKVIVRTNQIYDKGIRTEVTREYIFERDSVVYWWNKALDEYTVLYNLAADLGDEWEIKVGTESIVVHVDAVEDFKYEGKSHKMLKIRDGRHVFDGSIVIGFGHMTSFFPERLMYKSVDYQLNGLRCYWLGNKLFFHRGDEDCDEIYEQHHYNLEEIAVVKDFYVYPNPTNDIITLETQCIASLSQEYRITNLMGQILMTGILSEPTIDVSSLPSGMYFLNLGGQAVKFIKQ